MADFVGNDLSRLSSELDKLSISLPEGSLRITPEIVERNVGISKDFNNYELLNAIITRNILKATQIIQYFEQNPKNNPLVVTISVLFNFFSNLMLCYFSTDKSENGIMNELNLRSSFQSRDYLTAMRAYNAFKCIDITAGAGIEFRIKKTHGIVLEGRYYYGLGDIFKNRKKDVFAASHSQIITVSLGYLYHF